MTAVESVPVSPENEVREIFKKQTARRWGMAMTTADERIQRLERLGRAIRDRREQLYEALRSDFGKHPAETEITELIPTLEEIRFATHHLRSWMRPRRVPTPVTLVGATSYVRYEPKGVVLVLAPWNYPFYLAVNPVVAAIAAGNCVMLRPSDKTPATGRVIRDIIRDVFVEDEAAVIIGRRTVADLLLSLPFDHIFFTGSPAVGRKVMECAAKNLTPVTLELGGKSPVIVDESADLEVAAERVAWGKFVNSGQTCVAPDYALVSERQVEVFTAAVCGAVERAYGSSEQARAESTDLAHMVDEGSCTRLERAIGDTVAAGARCAMGGTVDVPARRITPTILTSVSADSAIMAEEIFGPVLPILAYRSLDEAIELVRARPKPLALYVFSQNRDATEKVLSSTTAGGTCVNNTVLHLGNPNLPFGGVGQSGMGNYHGRWGFETFSHARAVLDQKLPPALKLMYPPYEGRSSRVLALMKKFFG